MASLTRSIDSTGLMKTSRSANCYLSPKVIVSPSSAQQVSKVLCLCRFLGAVFSIRGGGHLQNPGFASNDGGVVICLSKFRDVTVSEDRKTANIGVGLTWLDVYRVLDKYDVAVTGGRMPSVGVSGLLLGGGLSFFVAQQGFSCSGVVNFEVSVPLILSHESNAEELGQVVLADSTIVNANARENSDLFWALKGGASNFGAQLGKGPQSMDANFRESRCCNRYRNGDNSQHSVGRNKNLLSF
jgi:FAD/FMN-containing dehydrogenase